MDHAAAKRGDRIECAQALLDPHGGVEQVVGVGCADDRRPALREAALRVDRARGARCSDDALGMWQALVDGRWSIVDHFHGGRRYFLALRNEAEARARRRLSARERQVVTYAAGAHANKLIAHELGLRLSTVATHLATAMAKLGLRHRTDLIAMMQRLATPASAQAGGGTAAISGAKAPDASVRVTRFELEATEVALISFSMEVDVPAELTEAERRVLDGLLRGFSDREIAATRRTSPRTVANQLRRLFQKLGVVSRAELVVRLSRPAN